MKRIEVIASDLDDTLVDTFGPKSDQWIDACKALCDIDVSQDDVISQWGKPLEEIIKGLTGIEDAEQLQLFLDHLHKQHSEGKYPKLNFPDFNPEDVLGSISKLGLRTAIVTSSSSESVGHDLETRGISVGQQISYLQTSDCSDVHKPDPRVFDPLLNHFSVDPGRVVYVGDTELDAEAALRAGMYFIGVDTGPKKINPEVSFDGKKPLAIVKHAGMVITKLVELKLITA